MKCFTCRLDPRSIGLICDRCATAIATDVAPQQILVVARGVSDGALVDQWGRAHTLGEHTEIGHAGREITIFEPSVSRHHASITRTGGMWTLHDLGSTNGTLVNQEVVTERVLSYGDRITFGRVGFYAVLDVEHLPGAPAPAVATGIRPTSGSQLRTRASPPRPLGISLLEILEPTGGGGGLVALAGASAQLSPTQLELVDLLVRRMTADAHLPRCVRGFVRSSELVRVLSWDTRTPDDTHVKQLVRRARRQLLRLGLGDLIESRHRFGYRLSVIRDASRGESPP